eukprot:752821-Hanusia_phi.AAC.2
MKGEQTRKCVGQGRGEEGGGEGRGEEGGGEGTGKANSGVNRQDEGTRLDSRRGEVGRTGRRQEIWMDGWLDGWRGGIGVG